VNSQIRRSASFAAGQSRRDSRCTFRRKPSAVTRVLSTLMAAEPRRPKSKSRQGGERRLPPARAPAALHTKSSDWPLAKRGERLSVGDASLSEVAVL